MSLPAILGNVLPAPSNETLKKVVSVEERIRQREQVAIRTEHIFHAGMYSRTVRLVPGTVITSVLIKIPTLIIVNGECYILAGDEWVHLSGYNVIPASAGRKQIYAAVSKVEITMVFPSMTNAVEDAESQFTDDVDGLLSRSQSDDVIIITGV